MSSSKKIKFSNVISTVRLKRGQLKIRQLRLVALVFMSGFLGVLIWLGLEKGQDFPLIIKICLGFSGCFLAWGVIDVLTSRVSFAYRPASDFLEIKARRKSFKLNYKGTGKDRLSLSVKKQMSGKSNRDSFCVILTYEDNECHIPFGLTGGFSERNQAEKELESWAGKLNLDVMPKTNEDSEIN